MKTNKCWNAFADSIQYECFICQNISFLAELINLYISKVLCLLTSVLHFVAKNVRVIFFVI